MPNNQGTGIVKVKDIGASFVDRGKRFRDALQSTIRQGLSRAEFAASPDQNGQGIHQISRTERDEIKDILKINKFNIHGIHALPESVANVSGFNPQKGFSETGRHSTLDEIKEHIDFAAEVFGGGHVVIHTGEFPRSIDYADFNEKNHEFEDAKGSNKDSTVFYVVNSKKEEEIQGIRNDTILPRYVKDSNGIERVETISFNEYYKEENKKNNLSREDASLKFFKQQKEIELNQMKAQQKQHEAEAKYYEFQADREKEQLEQIKNDPSKSEAEKKFALHQIETSINMNAQRARGYRDNIKQSELKLMEEKEKLKDWKTVNDYGSSKSFESFAELAIYSMDTQKALKLKKDIFVAPENIFPQMGYGSHPEELIDLVKKSRNVMAKKLVNERNFSEKEAKKESEKHIKATFDTQHLGMWFKHFKRKEGETHNQKLKRFNGWYMKEVEKLEKSGIIGNVHVVDGFGSHHHLIAGEGQYPVVDAVEYLKKKGYSGNMISEAHEQLDRMTSGTWNAFHSPLSGSIDGGYVGGGSSHQGSYLDRIQTEYRGFRNPTPYVVGPYAKSMNPDEWQMWSGTPLE